MMYKVALRFVKPTGGSANVLTIAKSNVFAYFLQTCLANEAFVP
jgi:hypothetical protein